MVVHILVHVSPVLTYPISQTSHFVELEHDVQPVEHAKETK